MVKVYITKVRLFDVVSYHTCGSQVTVVSKQNNSNHGFISYEDWKVNDDNSVEVLYTCMSPIPSLPTLHSENVIVPTR